MANTQTTSHAIPLDKNGIPSAFVPDHYSFGSPAELLDHISRYSFAQLSCNGEQRPTVTSLPLICIEKDALGFPSKLIGHMARRNPHVAGLMGNSSVRLTFAGPSAYVSPRWFVEKKTVPTWNYVTVEIEGQLKVIEEKNAILNILNMSIARFEQRVSDETTDSVSVQIKNWNMSMVEESYVDKLVQGIVGIEIEVSAVDGVKRLGQDKSQTDKQHIISGLSSLSDPASMAIAQKMKAG